MPNQITTNKFSTFNITAKSQTWILEEGVSINSQTGHGIYNGPTFDNSTIDVNGHIMATTAYKSGVYSEGVESDITIGTKGVIDGFNGVVTYGDTTFVSNNGVINASNIGIFASGQNVFDRNYGTIDANVGMYAQNAEFTLHNYGTMTGNFGMVVKDSAGYISTADNSVIDVVDTGILVNTKTGTFNQITNYGLIKSMDVAIQGGDGIEMVINIGTINGEIHLGAGNDFFSNGDGKIDHAIDGGSGNDIYYLSSSSDKIIDVSGDDTIQSEMSWSLSSYSMIENLELKGSSNANATGNMLANIITGNWGNNILDGGPDSVVDFLNGGSGNDIYKLGSGADIVADRDEYDSQGTKNAGTDTITSTISRNLGNYKFIENLTLVGSDNISGTGTAGANSLTGNTGNNTLNGAGGADKLSGGSGTDAASYAGASTSVIANLAAPASNSGDAKGDVYSSIENLIGSSHNDTLIGNSGANLLTGGIGNDVLVSDAGNDNLYGGAGADKMTGGTGADTFIFKAIGDTTVALAGRDDIFDFSHGQGDLVNLASIDANAGLAGNQAFTFLGTTTFHGKAGELRYIKDTSDTYVYGDINGDKKVDFAIHFDDAIAFQSGDFLL